MIIGLMTTTLSIPGARSLKDKRSVIRGLKDRIRNTLNVSVAETDSQDKWQSAELAFVTVAADGKTVDSRLATIAKRLRADPRWVLLDYHTERI